MPNNDISTDELLRKALYDWGLESFIQHVDFIEQLEAWSDKRVAEAKTNGRRIEELLDVLDGPPGWRADIENLIKARDDRIVAELEKQKDTHSHMTRNYCHDCAKRDGYNAAINQAIKVIRSTK